MSLETFLGGTYILVLARTFLMTSQIHIIQRNEETPLPFYLVLHHTNTNEYNIMKTTAKKGALSKNVNSKKSYKSLDPCGPSTF